MSTDDTNTTQNQEPAYVFRASRWNSTLGRVEYAWEHNKRAFKIPVREGWVPRSSADCKAERPKKARKPRGRKAPKN